MTDDQDTYDYDVFNAINARWPKIGDRLLSSGRDASFAQNADERNYRLLRGYKRAGDILIQNAMAERYHRPNLIFPALFCYRHYIELALKAAVEDHGAVAGAALTSKNHKLSELWDLFLKVASELGVNGGDEVIAVGKCIEEFINIDASSTVFRYARNVNGLTPPLLPYRIDLVNLHDVMNGIENFFECTEWAAQIRRDQE